MIGVINMNDEHVKTAQDVKIDKMAEYIEELFQGVNELNRTSVSKDEMDRSKIVLNNHTNHITKLNQYWSDNVNDVEDIRDVVYQIKIVIDECLERLNQLS